MQSSLQVAQDKAARTLLGLKRAFSKLNRECSYLDVEFWNLTQNLFLPVFSNDLVVNLI